MKKQIFIVGILSAVIFFYLGRLSKGDIEPETPNPDEHIRTAFRFLQENDSKSYEATLLSNDERRVLKKSRFEDQLPEEVSDMEEKIFWEIFIEEDYVEMFLEEFKDTRHEMPPAFEWKNAQIERITYKLKGGNKNPLYLVCNAKIYFRVGDRYFRAKYRQCIYYKGKWFGGFFRGIKELSDDDEEPVDFNILDYPSLGEEEYVGEEESTED